MPTTFLNAVIDLLEADPRPSFIVALTPPPSTVVYTNPAFSGRAGLLETITTHEQSNGELWRWITTGAGADGDPQQSSFASSGVYWTRLALQEQMVVVGANEQAPLQKSSRKIRLDVADDDGRPRSSMRAVSVDEPTAVVMSPPLPSRPSQTSLFPDHAALRRAKSTPGARTADVGEGLAAGPETVRPLSRSASEPGWILPDMMPGMMHLP